MWGGIDGGSEKKRKGHRERETERERERESTLVSYKVSDVL
jgi:hypothetical protein